MKLFIVLFILILLFAFPQSVGADSTKLDKLTIFYFDADENISYYNIIIPAWLTIENRALVVFKQVFDKTVFVPQGVKVLDVFFHNEYAHLVINLSAEILNYGGTYFEYRLVTKLLMNASGIRGVGYFSIMIDGQWRYLPEGTKLHIFPCII